MAHRTEPNPAGTEQQTGEVRNVVVVNLPHFLTQIETTTQQINDCVAENGIIYSDEDDVDNLYVELNSPAVQVLRDLHHQLQSQLRTVTTYATAVPMDNENYNFIQANAASAITTAKIYLGHAELLPDPNPNDPMDVDNAGDHTPSEAAVDNDPDTHEQAKSNEANDNSPNMQIADELNVLEINVHKDEMDLLCTERKNSSELSKTNALRDRAGSLH